MRALVMLVILSGCGLTWSTPADLHPIGPLGWSDTVAATAEEWNAALEVRGCGRVFELGETYDVVFYEDADWPHPANTGGITSTGGLDGFGVDDAHIDIRNRGPEETRRTLLHELGHALTGPEHTPFSPSILNAPVSADGITDTDVDYVVDALGCP